MKGFFESNLEGPGIHKWTHYFDIYHNHLSRFIGREISIVEIGVQSGGSLRMWRHYFGPNCRIFGIDVDPNCKAFENDQ